MKANAENINDRSIYPFNGEDAIEYCHLIEPSLKIMSYTEFADTKLNPPDLAFYEDDDQYFDPNQNAIHIGIFGILKLFRPQDEVEFYNALIYVIGHESQHRRSTSNKYDLAIMKGCEATIEYISSQVDSFKRTFRRPSDYEVYANNTLPSMGIYISWDMVRQIIAGITNSLEDGRIERIRSNRRPGFGNLRIVYRGKFWENNDIEFKPFPEIEDNKPERLTIVLNEILSLATCQLYNKGFAKTYSGTPVMDEVKEYFPYIGRAVMSGKTRGLLDPVVAISKKLAPYIYEVCKMSAEDAAAKQALENMLKSLLKSMIESDIDGAILERDEDSDDGSCNSAMPMSDLVITLDDETYDKLMENNKSSGNGGGIMVRREHPKDSEEEPSSENSSGGEKDGTENDADSEKPSDGKGPNSESSSDGNSSDSESSSDDKSSASGNDSSDDKSSGKNPEGAESSANDSSQGNNGDSKSDSSKKSESGKTKKAEIPKNANTKNASGSQGKDKAQKHVSKEIMTAAEKAVKEAMREAAEQANTEASAVLTSVNTCISSNKKASMTQKEVVDADKPISPAEMKDICDFKEVKREYKVTDNLPAVLAQRGKVLKRKNEQYFKSLSTPNVSYLDSGSIDPSRIYGLAMGDTEIFRKKGKDKKFDGCAYILIDNSGSMAGAKRMEACKAAAVIEEGFKGILPFKITAFDEYGCIMHEVVKGWDESLKKNCCWNFALHGRQGCGNEDGYDIQVAERELLARPERKKMLLVLSDGAPGNSGYCRAAIDHCRKNGIEVHGIYFEEGECRSNPTFEYMYQKDFVCCPLNELDENLNRIFKKFSRS